MKRIAIEVQLLVPLPNQVDFLVPFCFRSDQDYFLDLQFEILHSFVRTELVHEMQKNEASEQKYLQLH